MVLLKLPDGVSTVRWYRYSQADQWEAFLGLHMQSQTNVWKVRRNVKQIIAHHDYDPVTYNNDIALMELDTNITLSQNIWPICLPSPTYHFPVGCEAWVTGWGATREGGKCTGQKQFCCCWSSIWQPVADKSGTFPRQDVGFLCWPESDPYLENKDCHW